MQINFIGEVFDAALLCNVEAPQQLEREATNLMSDQPISGAFIYQTSMCAA